MTKQQLRSKIAEDMRLFLEDGGKIKYLPYDSTKEASARIGRWQLMGDDVHDDLEPRKYGERFTEEDFPVDMNEDSFAHEAFFDALADSSDYYPLDEREDW